MIKYIGSKRLLVPHIVGTIDSLPGVRTVLDLFSGTSRVGHALKRAGYRVIANDHNAYAHTLARCYIAADAEDVLPDAARLVHEFNALPGAPGYFTQTFCEQSRFFHPRNGERIDAVRDAIRAKCLEPELESVMLVSLMEAADRVDSTTGVQMAYLKNYAPRAHNPLRLRVPDVLPRAAPGKGEAHCMEAADAVPLLEADAAYIDPPYNQHSYLGNYHVWETLVRWDSPAPYGTACKREDCRTRRSPFNSRRRFRDAFESVIRAVRARYLIVSFSDEGVLSADDMAALLSVRGRVSRVAHDYKRYVGAQIGIFNPAGVKVGTPGRLRNTEYLFVVSPPELGKPPTSDADAHTPALTAGEPPPRGALCV